MSRIGNMPVTIPAGITYTNENHVFSVKGPKGALSFTYQPQITIKQEGEELIFTRCDDEIQTKELHGTTRAIIASMIKGVHDGYSKVLEIKGIGYHASMKGEDIELTVGFSHPHLIKALPNTKIEVGKDTTSITITGCDKQAVGQLAAQIRQVRKPEPYLGKGIAYKNEHIRRKEGKKAGK